MTEPPPAEPDVVEVVPRVRPTRGGRILGAAVLALAVVAAGSGATWLAMRDSGSASDEGSGICPDSMRNASFGVPEADRPTLREMVPAAPSVDGLADRLVPQDAPTSVVLCEYHLPYGGFTIRGDRPNASPGINETNGSGAPAVPVNPGTPVSDIPLGRTALHSGSDAALVPVLTMLQQATVPESGYYSCGGWPGEMPRQYLVRLTYDDGVVWVASPVDCTTTNGRALAQADLSQPVLDALDQPGSTGSPTLPSSTPTPPSSTPTLPSSTPTSTGATSPAAGSDAFSTCFPPDTRRPRADDPFVPFAPTSVTVCHAEVADGPSTSRTEPASVAVPLAEILDTAPPYVTNGRESDCPSIREEVWGLLFADSDGHRASVFVERGVCGRVDDKVRVRATSPEIFAQLDALD